MDTSVLLIAVVVAFVLYRLIDALVKPLADVANLLIGRPTPEEELEALKALKNLWPQYVAITIGSVLGWFTGLNAFPVFAVGPGVGRVLTCLVIGLGPSFIFDLVKGKPTLPANEA